MHADMHRLHQAEHAVIDVDLDQLGVLRPVFDAVLRQRAEWAKAAAQRQHHVGLRDHLHRRLGALVAERPAHQRMGLRERVVVQVGGDDRRLQILRELHGLRLRAGHHHAAARHDDRELGFGQQLRRLVQAFRPAGAALDLDRLRDGDVDLAIEQVARDVDLGRPALGQRVVEAAAGQLGDAPVVADMALELGDLGKDRQLLGLLETAQAHAVGAGLRRDHHHRRMRPIGGRDRGHEVGDAGAVLRDAHALLAADPRIAVGHVAGALLVRDRDEADAGRLEDVERVHVGRADDAEDMLHAMGDERFDKGLGRRHAGHGVLLIGWIARKHRSHAGPVIGPAFCAGLGQDDALLKMHCKSPPPTRGRAREGEAGARSERGIARFPHRTPPPKVGEGRSSSYPRFSCSRTASASSLMPVSIFSVGMEETPRRK